MGSGTSTQQPGYTGYIGQPGYTQNVMQPGQTTNLVPVSNQVPPMPYTGNQNQVMPYAGQSTYTGQVPMGQNVYNGQIPTGQVISNIAFSKQCMQNALNQATTDVIDKNTVGAAVKNCMVPVNPTTGIREGFNEHFAGVTQSADGSSVCVSYNALFWLVVIIILIVLLVKYRQTQTI